MSKTGRNGFTVFPALAGINRTLNGLADGTLSVPRASGDKPPITWTTQCWKKCSPR